MQQDVGLVVLKEQINERKTLNDFCDVLYRTVVCCSVDVQRKDWMFRDYYHFFSYKRSLRPDYLPTEFLKTLKFIFTRRLSRLDIRPHYQSSFEKETSGQKAAGLMFLFKQTMNPNNFQWFSDSSSGATDASLPVCLFLKLKTEFLSASTLLTLILLEAGWKQISDICAASFFLYLYKLVVWSRPPDRKLDQLITFLLVWHAGSFNAC